MPIENVLLIAWFVVAGLALLAGWRGWVHTSELKQWVSHKGLMSNYDEGIRNEFDRASWFWYGVAAYFGGICALPIVYFFTQGFAIGELGVEPEIAIPASVYAVSLLAAVFMVWFCMCDILRTGREESYAGELVLHIIGALVGMMVVPVVAVKIDPGLIGSLFAAIAGAAIGFGFVWRKMPKLKSPTS